MSDEQGYRLVVSQNPSFTIRVGKTMVTIRPDGTIEYGEGYTPDAAAKAFWDAMGLERKPNSEDDMTEDEDKREDLIYSLLLEFHASVGEITDEQKYAFIAGARAALVTMEERAHRT